MFDYSSLRKAVIACGVLIILVSCGKERCNNCKYDGVYDAFLFGSTHGNGPKLIISKGHVYFVDAQRKYWDFGAVKGDEWVLWDGYRIVLTRSAYGITAQVLGEDSFAELFRLNSSAELRLPASEDIIPVEETLSNWTRPPLKQGLRRMRWQNQWEWVKRGYGRQPSFSLDKKFIGKASLSNGIIEFSLRYVGEIPVGIMVNTNQFVGRIIVLRENKNYLISTFKPYEQAAFKLFYPGDVFSYSIDASILDTENKFSPRAGDQILCVLDIDMPSYAVGADWFMVGNDECGSGIGYLQGGGPLRRDDGAADES